MSFPACLLLLGGLALLSPTMSSAQLAADDASTPSPENEVARDAIDLREVIRTHPIDRDVVNTALVFNNTGAADTAVYCTAFDHDGRAVGRTRTKIPARGLRFLLASDFDNGRDFIGSALCSTDGRVSGSVVLLGGLGTTDLRVEHTMGRVRELIRFPLIASY